MREFVRVMKALSDPNRVMIVKMLTARAMCVCEITAALGLAQPTVSKHLKVLEAAGLVESGRNGPWIDYRVAVRAGGTAAAMLEMVRGLAAGAGAQEVLERAAAADRLRIRNRRPAAG